MALVKPIREHGIIISKIYNEAREKRTDMNGKEWPAKEEEYLLEVISCDEDDFNSVNGILNGTRCSYPVDKATYAKARFGDWVKVKFTLSQFGDQVRTKPESCILIEKQK